MDLNNKKILVTFLMHLGDLTLTTPFIHALRKAAPNAHITYLVDKKLQDVVLHNPYIDQVLTIDKKGKDDSYLALVKYAQGLSKMEFDLLINLHPNERCSFICALTKVKQRLGTTHRLLKWRWDKYTPLNKTIHAAEMYMDVLKQLGVENIQHNGLEIFPGPDHRAAAEAFWSKQDLKEGEKLVGLNIGSAVVTKRWAPDRFAAVADALASKGYRTVFFGGPMDEDMVKEAVAFMKTKPIIATGAFSIGALAAAMSRCSLIITNDSGPMHVAISQKVPIVAMYGPSKPTLYGPYTDEALVVTAQPPCPGCADGMKHQCADMRCMRDLTVEQVIEAAEQMLVR